MDLFVYLCTCTYQLDFSPPSLPSLSPLPLSLLPPPPLPLTLSLLSVTLEFAHSARTRERERERERERKRRALLGTFHQGGTRTSPARAPYHHTHGTSRVCARTLHECTRKLIISDSVHKKKLTTCALFFKKNQRVHAQAHLLE
jgi:hypothetical protein